MQCHLLGLGDEGLGQGLIDTPSGSLVCGSGSFLGDLEVRLGRGEDIKRGLLWACRHGFRLRRNRRFTQPRLRGFTRYGCGSILCDLRHGRLGSGCHAGHDLPRYPIGIVVDIVGQIMCQRAQHGISDMGDLGQRRSRCLTLSQTNGLAGIQGSLCARDLGCQVAEGPLGTVIAGADELAGLRVHLVQGGHAGPDAGSGHPQALTDPGAGDVGQGVREGIADKVCQSPDGPW